MGLTRRRLLAMTGGGAAGLAGVSVPGYAATSFGDASRAGTVPFLGPHQAGVTTPPQERLMFAAFDLTITTAPELRELLRAWTHAAALMTAGRPVGSPAGAADVAPADTGEAVGLPPARLTLTFGLGPGVFLRDGHDRFGLAARRPQALAPIGPLPGDQLVAAASGGDLCVQACADDPQVAFHAVRDLARIGRGAVVMRWTQLGFGRAASTSKRQATPRNLQGFKDGTNNLETADAAEMRRFVWVGGDEPQPWMRGGTYVVTRRIRMLIEKWDGSPLSDQEETIGKLVIPADAHIREASHVTNGGVRILRRGYSFTDGIDPDTGQLDAGLFFICFQRDPHAQFAVLQRRLGTSDALNEYIQHTSSAVFAVPTGVRPGGHIAEGLFEA
jgi:deferrochelatase/peroxidase EfeB